MAVTVILEHMRAGEFIFPTGKAARLENYIKTHPNTKMQIVYDNPEDSHSYALTMPISEGLQDIRYAAEMLAIEYTADSGIPMARWASFIELKDEPMPSAYLFWTAADGDFRHGRRLV